MAWGSRPWGSGPWADVPAASGGGSSLDLAASALAVSGAISASGDLQFRVPLDLSASAIAVTGSASVSGDIQSTTDPKLNISGSAIAVSGALSATGDIQITEAPTIDLSAASVAVTGTVSAAGTLAYRVPFNLAADPIIVAGVFAASGDIGLSTEPVGVRGGGGWAWAAPSDASRYKRLKPQTREQLAERVRKQREALGILPAPARKRIETAVKKEARRAAPSLAPLAPVAAEVAQDTGIALRRVLDAIEAAYDYQRGLVTARIEADAAHAEERRHQAAEQARVEAEAAEQEWQRRLVNLRAADDELLRQDDEARQQAIATIRQVQKALMALVTA